MMLEILLNRYNKMYINIQELSDLIGISKSTADKIFFKHSEKEILEKKLLPRWKKIGSRRLWSLSDYVEWEYNTVML